MGAMTDQELIAFLRRKYSGLLMAVLDYEECLEQTTPERESDLAAALRAGCGDAAAMVQGIVRRALEATGEKRAAAWERVREAGTMTFQEMVQVDPEMTDEQRAHWLAAE
jgi:hypothetical protein